MLACAAQFARSSAKKVNLACQTPSSSLKVGRQSGLAFSERNSQRWFQSTSKLQQQPVPLSKLSDNFLDGTSANYVEQMYQAWSKDKNSVHVSWSSYFGNLEKGVSPAYVLPPNITGTAQTFTPPSIDAKSTEEIAQKATEGMRLLNLVHAYQIYGHHAAKLDPLKQTEPEIPNQLKYTTYGFSSADLDREFDLGNVYHKGFLDQARGKTKLRDLIARLEETYCSTIGVEYMHIQDDEAVNWIRDKFETPVHYSYSSEEKVVILDRLAWATKFERFAGVKWSAMKRFGIDGVDSLIPGLKALIDRSADLGVNHVVFGMPHRGRLNVLANVVRKPTEAIFNEFAGKAVPEEDFYMGSGDVKYHLGTSYKRPTRTGKTIHLSLLANPSHLEAVNPVVEGKARATQYYKGDEKREQVMSMQIHGDAAFAGQGIVYETFGLSALPNYTTGGTVHIIVNNQIGFTTDPTSARGTRYCTDVAKAAGVPVFHVNADDPEAVTYVSQVAAEWRQKFHKDIVIDLIGYRKFGHNEGDEPRFTQPLMYKKIDAQQACLDSYADQLLKEKVITQEQLDEIYAKIQTGLEAAHAASLNYKPKKGEWLESVWKGFHDSKAIKPQATGVSAELLKKVGEVAASVPASFKILPQLRKILTARKEATDSGKKIDWGLGEALAYGTLLMEGTHVRLSGQDVERGTFSHRHGVIHDQNTNQIYVPLNNISEKQEKFTLTNSNLSEFGVLGFELGYSLTNPNCLVLWEAQFGDFSNGAQIIIDQFIASGESKWKRQSGLVMLLPHGYDGAGPEHSSARLERYLALCDADPDIIPADSNEERIIQRSNLQVINPTTPANFFHALRRQVHRAFRKPLIVMTPKYLLRHPRCSSSLSDFQDGTSFQTVIPDNTVDPNKVERLVFCSGKVHVDLMDFKEKNPGVGENVALVRVEQLHPFPFAKVQEQLKKHPKAHVAWVQEEPKNSGAWPFIGPHLRTAGKETRGEGFYPTYIGRASSASPATGYPMEDKAQVASLMKETFTLNKK